MCGCGSVLCALPQLLLLLFLVARVAYSIWLIVAGIKYAENGYDTV